MQRACKPILFQAGVVLFFVFLLFASEVLGNETTNSWRGTNEPSAEAQQSLRAYLQLQEQVHAAMLAIEQNRQEANAAVQRNAEVVSTRLKMIEQTLSRQSEQGMEVMQKSNRMVMVTAGIFGGVGLLAMVVTAIFLFHTMNRLAEISTAPKGLALGPSQQLTAGPPDGAAPVITLPPESTRLLGAIERLDKRIQELEIQTVAPQLLTMAKDSGQGNGNGKREETSENGSAATIEPGPSTGQERVSVILGKGQTLLNLGQPENALVCFDEVLELEPENAEALVKKGTALERLRRWEEALQCYDRAIVTDSEMTLAYLYKGGVFNQLERFSEALECYEQALRTQQRTVVAVG